MRKGFFAICSVLLVLVVSIAVVVPGCDGNGGEDTYDLTMAVAPPGSGTANDLTGTSPYAEDTAVNITAAALGSYQFCEWTAPAGTFADPNAATTTFTMPAQNVTVTANFVGPLDHFKSYNVTDAQSLEKSVSLKDQFIELDATVKNAAFFCNPTDKVVYQEETLISNPDHHLTLYWINHQEYGRYWNVEVTNQFNEDESQYLTVGGPVALAVPTQKLEPGGHESPVCLDHYMVYAVVNNVVVDVPVELKDEFGVDPEVMVGKAIYFANPVQKTVGSEVTEITTDEHLVFYQIVGTEASCPQVQVDNQFGPQTLNLGDEPAILLGVPSVKVDFEQLDHFTVYPVTAEPDHVDKVVSLEDQFVDIQTLVGGAWYFCNPAAKMLTESPVPVVHPDYHIIWYGIDYMPTQQWTVEVENQFGKQTLNVAGPDYLAVPTQKLVPGDHGWPDGLDHFLIYKVTGGEHAATPVSVNDQFINIPSGDPVSVGDPAWFAVPAQKTVGANVTPITNPMTHVLFYNLANADYSWPQVQVLDQFQGQTLTLGEPAVYLGVPSLKLSAEELQP